MASILVVDDDQDNLYAIRQRLESQKIDTLTASNGRQAISLARKSRPDLILLDVHMPFMDGFETCRLLKKDSSTKNIPVIFLTARYLDIGYRVKGLDLGAHDYLVQPFAPDEFMARIRAALRQKELYDQFKEVLFQKEKLANVGKIVTSIVHEINNPLTAVAGAFSLFKEDVPDKRCVELAEEGIGKIRQIIEQLLNFHRLRCMDKAPVNLNTVFMENMGLVAPQLRHQGIRLLSELSENLRPIQGVNQQLSLVSLNLILNASEAMSEGGTLTIGSKNQGDNIKVWVRDTGSGILPENVPKIFEPFFTTKKSGTGIGLFLVKTLVEANEGSVEAQSQPGEWTEFTMTFPLNGQQRPPKGEN